MTNFAKILTACSLFCILLISVGCSSPTPSEPCKDCCKQCCDSGDLHPLEPRNQFPNDSKWDRKCYCACKCFEKCRCNDNCCRQMRCCKGKCDKAIKAGKDEKLPSYIGKIVSTGKDDKETFMLVRRTGHFPEVKTYVLDFTGKEQLKEIARRYTNTGKIAVVQGTIHPTDFGDGRILVKNITPFEVPDKK